MNAAWHSHLTLTKACSLAASTSQSGILPTLCFTFTLTAQNFSFSLFLGLDLKHAYSFSDTINLEERCGCMVRTTPSKEETQSQRKGLGKITLTIRLLQLTQLINILTANVHC